MLVLEKAGVHELLIATVNKPGWSALKLVKRHLRCIIIMEANGSQMTDQLTLGGVDRTRKLFCTAPLTRCNIQPDTAILFSK